MSSPKMAVQGDGLLPLLFQRPTLHELTSAPPGRSKAWPRHHDVHMFSGREPSVQQADRRIFGPASALRTVHRLVDQQSQRRFGGRTASGRQGVEEVRQNTLSLPSLKMIVERLPRAIDSLGIFPPAPGYQHMHDAADHPTIIDPRLATSVLRQMRLEAGKLESCVSWLPGAHHPFFPQG